jgi:GntR family transcriptional repressor for pyruvate dehydrogenase complex
VKARIARKRNIIAVDDDSLVSERIFTFFKEQFLSGELKPGDTLLPERELAQRLGVSRPTLREVMRAMALLGVIEIRRGQKAVVAAPSADVLQNFFGILLWMRPSIYQHILEARIAVECQAVRLACVNAQAEDIEGLRLALARIQDTASDADAGAEADFDFHTLIVLASHNEVLRFIHEAVATLLRKSHRERRQQVSGQSEFLATLGDAHRQLLNAIVARDPDAAETAVRQHFYIAQEHERRKSVQQAGFAPSKISGKRANGR